MINRLLSYLVTSPQYLLPQHFLSQLISYATQMRWPPGKNFLIRQFIRYYQIDLNAAIDSDINSYPNFRSFFTRRLRPELRPMAPVPNGVISPVDGKISAIGTISRQMIIQAKGQYYSIEKLLGGNSNLAEQFFAGDFITLYLAPRDYHRVHIPVTGRLRQMIYIPGWLFSVNRHAVQVIPELFVRNERVVTIFDTDFGLMAIILIGALFVGSIETSWMGIVTPGKKRSPQTWTYPKVNSVILEKGAEVGCFNMGSTVIILFSAGSISWEKNLVPERDVQMGELIGTYYG